ncbi:cap-specific mRNA (nucleoside-2'-O-)-methyltransferase 2 isoform X1 [Leptopilina heterotoma]|uniref:cap-specific mRNA (nucleoside-2'-O-)-methyltransferase 2 isoform X1 n=1 Tax=Leptopilina heterotoma TaxID=63436 RepID=UPI001CA986EB|nr:cap-specific mRNA (nucleoside-2'-O-)-methyltransferase 2 isoform X1 [Leptopilina heterotoma]
MDDYRQFQKFNVIDEVYIEDTVNASFNKIFSFENNGDCCLPNSNTMFKEDAWHIKELYDIKSILNDTKSKLNNYRLNEWSEHTRKRNKAGSVIYFIDKRIEPEFVTQAWCKFYEIVSRFPLVPNNAITNKSFTSVHLCEAPGAFITSLNHWLKSHHPLIKWDWIGTTLNPYYEGNSIERMITDDRFIIHTLEHWEFGPYNTGNIVEEENREQIIENCRRKDVYLVTADGSVDCSNDPGEQEQIVTQLHHCETITALNILSEGGSFLLKMFTIFEHTTVSLLYLLFCCFESIHMFKPATSKEGNSEVYVICLNFKSFQFMKNREIFNKKFNDISTKAMFCREDIPDNFIQEIIKCAEFFKNHQCKVILENIESYDKNFKDVILERIKRTIAERYIDIYELKKLHNKNSEIVGRTKLMAYNNFCCDARSPLDSYNERRSISDLEPVCRLKVLLKLLQNIETLEKDYRFERETKQFYKLWINFGKPYRRIQSSKFVPTKILKTLNQSFEVMEIMNICSDFTTEESVIKYLDRMRFNEELTTIIKFKHINEENNYQLINDIYETLGKIAQGNNLVFIGYSLFSQMNVGLLKLVSRFFYSMNFQPDNNLGYVIIFNNLLSEKNTISRNGRKNFDQLLQVAKLAKSKEKIILSVFSMLDLYETVWMKNITYINLWNIKCFAKNIREKIAQEK